ncbi:MAG: gliding motility protein GldM [Chitinophagaceae bacterium]|nr:gliding motility protein GldM [Chitinophagaceae bacterium]
MALPREPRQKMINIMYLVLTAILALNVSAEVINAFKTVDRSLRNSNDNLSNSNNTLYKSLSDKVNDPQTHEKAVYWNQKAVEAQNYSAAINNYINGLKDQVKKEADLKIKNGVEDYKEDYLEASTRVFENNGKGKELYDSLQKYIKDMLGIDSSINTTFKTNFPVDMSVPPTHSGNEFTGNIIQDWTNSYFHMTPTVAALTMLSKFQNNVKNAENQVVTYCHNQVGAVKVVYDQFAALVGQSSNYVMPGQEIEITAGVGAYSKAAQPDITINGAGASLDADGRAVYKFNASGGGDHSVPVNVTYTKPDGTKETKSFDVKYTVGTPGGAAVMVDKMNVFFIGLPNPVTISSGTGWDKTHVSISGGTLTPAGGPGKYNVTVSSPGKATITVNADGKASTYDFRIFRIPDPILKVGPSAGGRIQSVIFKNQQFARADLENFYYDTRFSVISATVYFSGANFASVQTASISGGSLAGLSAQLSKCIPGTSVTFDNVKVQGPDGTVRTIPGPGFILY